jgi:hypothetical protein
LEIGNPLCWFFAMAKLSATQRALSCSDPRRLADVVN